MKAKYYDKNQLWVITTDKGDEIKYPIELVTVELVEYFAKLKDKIGKDIGWERLSNKDKEDLLAWFEKEVFPTKEFGEFLIDEITSGMLEEIGKEEEEESFSVSFSDLVKQYKEGYLKHLSGYLSQFLGETAVEVAKEHTNDKEKLDYALSEIIAEWQDKDEFEARFEALKDYDVYAIEDLKRSLEKKGVSVDYDEILNLINRLPDRLK